MQYNFAFINFRRAAQCLVTVSSHLPESKPEGEFRDLHGPCLHGLATGRSPCGQGAPSAIESPTFHTGGWHPSSSQRKPASSPATPSSCRTPPVTLRRLCAETLDGLQSRGSTNIALCSTTSLVRPTVDLSVPQHAPSLFPEAILSRL